MTYNNDFYNFFLNTSPIELKPYPIASGLYKLR